MGLDTPVAPAEAPPQEGVGQQKDLSEEPKSTRDSDTVLPGGRPTLKQDMPGSPEPFLSRGE